MAFIEAGADSVEYEVEGRGSSLVLIHGTGADAQSNWAHLVPQLAEDWRVIRPNYSGSGRTRDKGAPLTMKQVAGQVMAAARAAGAGPYVLVGYSLGAAIAAYIAAEHPDEVSAVVLLAGFACADDTRLKLEFELWRTLIASDRRAFSQNVLLTGFSPAFVSAMSPQQIEDTLQMMLANNDWEGMSRQIDLDSIVDVRDQVRRISQPTLVIGCEHDHMVPVQHAQLLAQMIPGAIYQEMETGHLAPLEQPQTFVRLLREFQAGR